MKIFVGLLCQCDYVRKTVNSGAKSYVCSVFFFFVLQKKLSQRGLFRSLHAARFVSQAFFHFFFFFFNHKNRNVNVSVQLVDVYVYWTRWCWSTIQRDDSANVSRRFFFRITSRATPPCKMPLLSHSSREYIISREFFSHFTSRHGE